MLKNLRLTDVAGWLPITVLTFFFAYYFLGVFDGYKIIYSILLVVLYLAYAMCINNYFDWKNDARNPVKIKKNPISSGRITRSEALLESLILLLGGVLIASVFLPAVLPLYGLMMANAFLYSYRFKSMPVIDLLSHGIFITTLFVLPALVENFSAPLLVAGTLLAFFVSTVGQLENEINDYPADRKAHVNSTAVFFGTKIARAAYYASNALCLLSLAALFYVLDDFRFLIFIPLVLLSAARLDSHFVRKYFEKMFLLYVTLALIAIIVL
ncbi:MAG: UbiA family prenyltransferase [Candidatus Aenigmarchaeota archaeon]|nr:UbiA family prenyltransferase [Candidatus Aenigmarchaeota archaeon]